MTVGPPDEVLSDPRVISAYLGGDIDVINRSGGAPSSNGGLKVRRRQLVATAKEES